MLASDKWSHENGILSNGHMAIVMCILMLVLAWFIDNNKFIAGSWEVVLYAVHEFGPTCFIMLTSNFVKNFPCKSCPYKSFLEGSNRNCDIMMDCQMPLEFVEVSIRISSIDVFDGIHCSHADESRPSAHQRWRRSYRAKVVKYLSPSVEAWTRDTENRAYIFFSPASFPEPKSAILQITANVPVDHHSRGSMLWKRWEGGYKYTWMHPWAREDELLY